MFDFGLTKLAVIGIVALVVIGPERLPRVARTVGALLGRARRTLNEIKDEITREIELEDLKKIKANFEKTTQSLKHPVDDRPTKMPFNATNDTAYHQQNNQQTSVALNIAQPEHPISLTRQVAVRKKYRFKYKRSTVQRHTAQASTARMARHKTAKLAKLASIRQPTRFF